MQLLHPSRALSETQCRADAVACTDCKAKAMEKSRLTDSGNGGNNLAELELVKNGGLSGGIESDHKNTCEVSGCPYRKAKKEGNGAWYVLVDHRWDLSISSFLPFGLGFQACNTHASPSCRRGPRADETLRDPLF